MPAPSWRLRHSILIVEDEPLIAMMLEDFLDSLGHKVRGTCDTVKCALDEVEKGGFDLAILDVNLKGENVWPVATRLREKKVPLRHRDRRPCRSAAARVRRRAGDREALYGRPGHAGDRSRVRGLGRVFDRRLARRSSAMFEFQSQLIFPIHSVPRAGPLPPGAERLSVETPDGQSLAGVHIPPDHPAKDRTLVLGFGGNGWNGQDVAEYLHQLFPDDEVVAFHYRGYTPSTGSPSAEALIADAPLVYDFAVKARSRRGSSPSASASAAASPPSWPAKRQLDGLILVTPFDSLKAVAQAMYPWLPIGPFFDHEIDAAAASREVDVPVALVAAERDEIVPAERTEALRESGPQSRVRPNDCPGGA